ncbi:MAG: FctA domain-containing protein [Bacillota bacterium]|nr:FctA domain-containing protein [Bacillota bacterium]
MSSYRHQHSQPAVRYRQAAEQKNLGGGLTASKTITDNGDGTYTLNLNVPGKKSSSTEATKANVLIVLDLSNSMKEKAGNNYAEHNTGNYGLVDGKYVQLYRQFLIIYTEIGDDKDYEGDVYIKNGNTYSKYEGTRYKRGSSRLDVAKTAIAGLIESLAANNKDADDDMVEISFMTFATRAHTGTGSSYDRWHKGRDMSALKKTVEDVALPGGNAGGTNWDDALHEAIKSAKTKEANDGNDTYIVFVSDGDPTFYMDADHKEVRGSGNSTSDNTLNAAYEEADKIKAAGYKFYGIGVFGTVGNMQTLCERANGSYQEYYYSATDQETLEEAFASIINGIISNDAFKDVTITDNITSLTATADMAVDPDSFTYSRSDNAPYEGPPASYDGKTVTWSLGEDTVLDDGVIYTVSFRVWPSQEAYDLVADLNNGTKSYDALDEDVKGQLVKDGDSYFLSTNTQSGNKVDYTQIETKECKNKPAGTDNPDGSVTGEDGFTYVQQDGKWIGTRETHGSNAIEKPDPISVEGASIDVKKKWDGGTGNGEIEFKLLKDGNDTGVKISLSEENKDSDGNWIGQVYLAPGLTAGTGSNAEDLNPGHDYTLEEVNTSEEYSFTSGTSHPMLVNGNIEDKDGKDCILVGTNKFAEPVGTSVSITAKKELKNLTLQEDQFKFGLYDSENNLLETVGNAADGKVEFSPITYGSVGEFKYYIKEIVPEQTAGGINYDTGAKEATVKVTDNNGKLEAAVNYGNGNTFTNKYDASGENSIKGLKTVENYQKALEGGEFTFTISGEDGAPLPKETTVENDADGIVDFGQIEFKLSDLGMAKIAAPAAADKDEGSDADEENAEAEGTSSESAENGQNAAAAREKIFTYTVKEAGSMPGVVNAGAQTFRIKITDNGNGGIDSVMLVDGEEISAEDPAFIFNNIYKPANASLSVQKNFADSDGNSVWEDYENAEFTFKISGKGGAPLPENTEIKATSDNTYPSFGAIKYDKAGTYEYTIKETKGSLDGVTYDTSEHTATVKVTRNDDNSLSAEVKYDGNNDGLTITNTVEKVTVSGEKTKDKTGADGPKTGDQTNLPVVLIFIIAALAGAGAALFAGRRKKQDD